MAFIADLISCRMYISNREAVNGFTKNLFAAFNFHLLPFLFVFTWLAVMFWEPLIILLVSLSGQPVQAQAHELVACLGLSLLLWLIPYADMRMPLWLACLYPFTILANDVVAIRSLWHTLGGHLSWKGRAIPPPRWRWL